MNIFNLPKTTSVEKVIPKNAFDSYTSSKQKKQISDCVSKITWSHKLSTDTTNLQSKEIIEIQVFNIELKEKVEIKSILSIIDKAIPYLIIFVIRYSGFIYISTSPKHSNPHNENTSVIDYTFSSDWFEENKNTFHIELKNNLDFVYKTFCEQFNTSKVLVKNIKELVSNQKDVDNYNKEIQNLKSTISKCKQFNKKVELNMKLKDLENKSN